MTAAIAAPRSSQVADKVTGAIARAASGSGVDFNYLLGQARIESGLDPQARARTSSATGLYQFTRQTWLATLKRHGPAQGLEWAANAIETSGNGTHRVRDAAMRTAILDLREDPDAASAMAAAFASDNAGYLESRLGREAEPVDLYMAHFLGPDGAARFLAAHQANPGAAAASLFPEAAQANRGVFYAPDGTARSLDDIRSRFAARLAEPGAVIPPSGAPRKVMEFAQHRADDFAKPMALRAIEPMPQRLSLEFAQRTYQRLASLPEGNRA